MNPPRGYTDGTDGVDPDDVNINAAGDEVAPVKVESRQDRKFEPLSLAKSSSRVGESHDGHTPLPDGHEEVPYEVYSRFSPRRKAVIVIVISWCGLLSPISSTAVLSAIPEVADTYGTSGDVIALSNALYLVFMGLSPCFWGPLSQVYGRRWVCLLRPLTFSPSG